jgi:hypothetical protein
VRSAGKTHAFANDRTDIDLLGTRRDAAAFADLLLLDDLVPPIAVGRWAQERARSSAYFSKKLPAVPRLRNESEATVPKVVQINFDAWSHADAENLRASLTAELFKPGGKLRTGLTTEIAKRLRTDADASPLAAAAVESRRAAVQDAETKLAKLEHEPVAATVAGEMAQELIAAATPKELGEDDKKSPKRCAKPRKPKRRSNGSTSCFKPAGYQTTSAPPEKVAPILRRGAQNRDLRSGCRDR